MDKVTRGNDFVLRARLWQRTADGREPIDMMSMENISVVVRDHQGHKAAIEWELDAQFPNALLIKVSHVNRASSNPYGIEVTMCTHDGRHLRSADCAAFGLAEVNKYAKVTFKPYGDDSGAELDMDFEFASTAVTSDKILVGKIQDLFRTLEHWSGVNITQVGNEIFLNY